MQWSLKAELISLVFVYSDPLNIYILVYVFNLIPVLEPRTYLHVHLNVGLIVIFCDVTTALL